MKNFSEVIEKVKSLDPFIISVAAAEDKELLLALKAAAHMGFVKPILVGNVEKIQSICDEIGLKPYDIVAGESPEDSAKVAVSLVKSGKAQVLMKGLVNTSVYMRAILNKEKGLRTGRLISMLAVYELPGYHKLLYCTDSGINVAPTLAQKKDILNNSLIAMKGIGVTNPKVAALTANEMVDEKIQSTVDAKGLVDMVGNGEILPCTIEGPIAFDVAFSKDAAHHKGIDSKIAGDCDMLVFPNIETGNALGKSWLHFNNAKWAGIVLGATNPIILGSRSDTQEIKINSIALGCLASAGSL
ncbi:MAG: phosphate acyltransferase [Anaeromicrobium sp.]|nr:phosphate acyltransferase [Anaeromicrobium sp.]